MDPAVREAMHANMERNLWRQCGASAIPQAAAGPIAPPAQPVDAEWCAEYNWQNVEVKDAEVVRNRSGVIAQPDIPRSTYKRKGATNYHLIRSPPAICSPYSRTDPFVNGYVMKRIRMSYGYLSANFTEIKSLTYHL